MSAWRGTTVAEDWTHHLGSGVALYQDRFDEVLAFHEPGLAPVRRGPAAWHVDATGRQAYARRFLRTFGFYEGRAAVVSREGWHHILASGSDLYAERYSWCGNYQGGRCPARATHGAYFHLLPDGGPAYEEHFRYAGDFRDGLAVVQAEDRRSSHIDRDGRLVHGRWYRDLDVFHKGAARARDEGGWMHVTRGGDVLYGRRFAMVEPFYNGQARVERFDGGLEVIDEAGTTLVDLRPAARQ